MDKMIAYCGINCSDCPAFLATRADDDDMRHKVVVLWSKQFQMKLSDEDINCDGCKTDNGCLFGHCRTCRMRACCSEKKLDTCADCSDYECEELKAFHTFVPQAKEMIEKIRQVQTG